MKEGKKWLALLGFLPAIVFFTFTNYIIDPANIFHDESQEMAESIVAGNAVYSTIGNLNEREIRRNIIMNMPDEVDCIAVGPSLVMAVDSGQVGSEDFYNLGMSGADLYDILAQFGMMEAYGKKADKVLFCVDANFFSDRLYGSNVRSKELMPYSDYMVKLLNGQGAEVPEFEKKTDLKVAITQLFSITYFQASIDYIRRNGKYWIQDLRWGIVGEDFDGSQPYYRADGSWAYPDSYQNNGAAFVQNEAKEYAIDYQFSRDWHISEYSKDLFEKLIQRLQNEGTEVKLFLCPMSPSLWDRVNEEMEHYPIIEEMENYAHDMAEQYGLKLTGSYNPYHLGMSDEHFYDSRHVRHDVFDDYFDLK